MSFQTPITIAEAIDNIEANRYLLHHPAGAPLAFDLDDGVKVNYLKFAGAVQPIAGLAAKED